MSLSENIIVHNFASIDKYVYTCMCLYVFCVFGYSDYVTSTNTVKPVTYTNWETRFEPVSHNVTMLVTPRVQVRLHILPILANRTM